LASDVGDGSRNGIGVNGGEILAWLGRSALKAFMGLQEDRSISILVDERGFFPLFMCKYFTNIHLLYKFSHL
jgi:hypothetical protein